MSPFNLVTTDPTCGDNNGAIDMAITAINTTFSGYANSFSTGGNTPSQLAGTINSAGIAANTTNSSAITNGNPSVTLVFDDIIPAGEAIVFTTPSELNAILTPEFCEDRQGGIDLMVSGTGPFTYDWSDNSLDGTEDPFGLGSGE